jgi:hypothetical protein
MTLTPKVVVLIAMAHSRPPRGWIRTANGDPLVIEPASEKNRTSPEPTSTFQI